MRSILIVTPQNDLWKPFVDALQMTIPAADITRIETGLDALEVAHQLNPLAMVIDEQLADMTGVELVKRLLPINAMISTALASDHPEDVFHDETEGLGILMKLSLIPTSAEAGRFAKCLKQVTGAIGYTSTS